MSTLTECECVWGLSLGSFADLHQPSLSISGPTFLCLGILGATVVNFVLRFLERDDQRLMRGLQS